ncbi:hypothetical protein V474_03275 [Novosphingobium barchaimii LL02]|uniref:HTH marR-type domain-containing protein n=1 Tax=Novosphingobium barchaimii LL02 TaxID=1114963 RepID=A0A0J8A8K7_9SPHN|nr:MarR family transcriptional regulator [Novosphingobium barchaimii]KMS51665.1 hypothetical protein V474_03275 [Novosphingobium barchaimii LL02]
MPLSGSASDADDRLKLDRQLCFPLYAATNLLQRLYRPLLAPLGLTYSQYLVMMVLWDRKSVSVGELQNCLYLDVGTLSPLLKRMERDGLVTRKRDPADERRVLVNLTPHGDKLKSAASQVPIMLAANFNSDPADMQQLYELSTTLVGRLSDAVTACKD